MVRRCDVCDSHVLVVCLHVTNDAVRQNRISISRVHSSILRIAKQGAVRFGSRVLDFFEKNCPVSGSQNRIVRD